VKKYFKLPKIKSSFFKLEKPKLSPSWIFVGFVVTLAIGFGLGLYSKPLLEIADSIRTGKAVVSNLDLSPLQDTYKTIKKNYDGVIDEKKLIDAANKGMAESLGDDYTIYLTPSEAQKFDEEINGYVGAGIGVEIGKRFDMMTVLRVLADHPAFKAGIQKGDVILRVDGQSTEGWTVEETASKVRGEIGTNVNITVLRGGKSYDYTITRAVIDNKSVNYSNVGGIGIIQISRFDMDTGELTRKAATDLKSQGVKGIVLDLRNNGGGYVDAAQAVAGVWLDKKLLFTEKSGDKVIDVIYSTGNPVLEGVPTVVLVNGSSASASEIVAGAFQDYKVASIVGEQSFGKGSVQQLFNLENGSQLKVTIARWFTPNNANITKGGITPSVVVKYTDTDANSDNDTQLKEAIKILNQ